MDAIKFLTRQHRRIESLFSRYERWPARAPAKGRDLFGLIERAIIPHAVLEEMYIYPLIRQRVPGGDALAEEAIRDHAEVERTLKRMSSISPESAEFDTAMREVIDSVQHHVHEEESEPGLFKMLRETLTARELNELGRTLAVADNITPTRAHPSAPDRPPGNMIMGLPTAMMDRLRDRLTGRAERADRVNEEEDRADRERTAHPARQARSRRGAQRKRATGSRSVKQRATAKRGTSRRRAAGAGKGRTTQRRARTTRTKARRK